MAYSEHRQNVILCYCSTTNGNTCPTSSWIFGLTANVNVNESARTWNVVASTSFNFLNTSIYQYQVRAYDMTINGHNYGIINDKVWFSNAGATTYLSVVVASGTYDINGNPSQTNVNVTASCWISLYTDACSGTGSRKYTGNTSVSVAIPKIAALNRPPSITSSSLTSSNPNVYQLNAGISGIDWGLNYSNPTLKCTISYSLDGTNYSWIAGSWTGSNSSRTLSVDGMTLAPSSPWTRIPEDETVTITWTASTSVGSSTISKTQYCMSQYEAFVIKPGDVIPADLYVSTLGAAPNPNLPIRRISTIKA